MALLAMLDGGALIPWAATEDGAACIADKRPRHSEHRAAKADPKSFLVPGFWPTRYIVTTAEMQLIEEAGRWKVVGP